MKYQALENYRRMSRENQALGLVFGLIMGLAYAFGAWGLDGLELSGAMAALPWLKLAMGSVLCLPLCLLAGWVTSRFDRALVGAASWALTAAACAWIAGHLPYEFTSLAHGWLETDFRGLTSYPFVESSASRLVIAAVISIAAAVLCGVLQINLVDSARATPNLPRRLMALALISPLFLGAALATDSLVNHPLRQPLVEINNVIELSLDTAGVEIDKSLARDAHLGAVRAIQDLLPRPRRLFMGYYEPTTLDTVRVLVDFSGEWAICWVIANTPSFCQPSETYYARAMNCLWEQGGLDETKCKIRLAESARLWLEKWQEYQAAGQAVFATPLDIQVLSQRGEIAWVEAAAPDGAAYRCRLTDGLVLTWQECLPTLGVVLNSPSSALAAGAISHQPTNTAEPSGEAVMAAPGEQPKALLPFAMPEAQQLPALPVYAIQVELKPEEPSYQGRLELTYTNLEETALEQIYLRLLPNGRSIFGPGELTISGLRLNGHPLAGNLSELYSTQNTVLEIPLAQALPPGGKAQIQLDFAGKVPRDFGGLETPEAYGIYNLAEGVLNLAGWYPLLAVFDQDGWNLDPLSFIGDPIYADMAYYSVEITLPQNWILAATGVAVFCNEAPGIRRCLYDSGPVREFFMTASQDFLIASDTLADTVVNSYYLPGSEDGGLAALQITLDALRTFNEKFGRYPYTELDVIQSPMRNAGGVEYPGIFLIEADRYQDPTNSVFIITVAHEAAHQWWYNLVGNDVFDEPWLDEALATYSSGVYYEAAFGQEYYDGLVRYWQDRYDSLVELGQDAPVTRPVPFWEDPAYADNYGGIVYTKGALFLHKLRQEIGDRAFFLALQTYFQNYRYKIAAGTDLLNLFEQTSGKSLGAFFENWLYSP